jgi:hypothetical protein
MSEWLTINLNMLKQIMSERKDIDRREAELIKRKSDLDKLASGLKTLLEVAIETSSDERAKAQYDRICKIAAAGGDPTAKINKTHLMLEVLKKSGPNALDVTTIQQKLLSLGVEVDRNYIHTVLNKLRSPRGLVAKEGDSFVLTEKGRSLTLKTSGAD